MDAPALPTVLVHFTAFEDPQVERTKLHPLLSIVAIALCGVICEGSNEIPAIPAPLRLLVLRGCIVTEAAIGCQTAVVQAIRAQGTDYGLALKENQGTLYQAVAEASRSSTAHSRCDCPGGYI